MNILNLVVIEREISHAPIKAKYLSLVKSSITALEMHWYSEPSLLRSLATELLYFHKGGIHEDNNGKYYSQG